MNICFLTRVDDPMTGLCQGVDTFRRAAEFCHRNSEQGREAHGYHGPDLGSLHPASTWCPCLRQSEAGAGDHWPMRGPEPASHPSLSSWPASAQPQPLSYLQRDPSEVTPAPEASLWLVSCPWYWPLIGPSCDVSPRPWSHSQHPGSWCWHHTLTPGPWRRALSSVSTLQPWTPAWVRSLLLLSRHLYSKLLKEWVNLSVWPSVYISISGRL